MTYAEVAARHGWTERAVQRWARAGALARYRIGNEVYFSQADVDAFIAASRIPAGGEG